MKLEIILGMILFISSCYQGLPYDDNEKYPEVDMVAIGLTHAVLHDDPQLLSQFRSYARNVLASLESQPGFI